jgi:hypothetical protein
VHQAKKVSKNRSNQRNRLHLAEPLLATGAAAAIKYCRYHLLTRRKSKGEILLIRIKCHIENKHGYKHPNFQPRHAMNCRALSAMIFVLLIQLNRD